MFYGHFDKQPPFTGWHEGKGPTTPVIEMINCMEEVEPMMDIALFAQCWLSKQYNSKVFLYQEL